MSQKRYLPQSLLATLLVAGLPLAVVSAVEASGYLHSPILAIALTIAASLGAATAGAAIWMRCRGSKDIVFGDLMLWGWIRRARTEKRLAKASALLGLDERGARGRTADLDPERQVAVLERLASALEARDSYTHGHSRRVTRYSAMIARGMGLSREEIAKVRTAASVHDVGKINIPREVLNKPGKLTDEEFAIMKRHSSDGAEMVVAIGDVEITAMVRHHHERLDGAGYPDGLLDSAIPRGACIIAVADTFDAITSSRAYRAACPHKKAIEVLKKEAGTQLDREAVDAFLNYYSGKKALAFWSFLTTAPDRLLGWLSGAFQGASAAPIAKGAVVMGAAAALGGSMAGTAVPMHGSPEARPVKAATAEQVANAGSGSMSSKPEHTAGKTAGDRARDTQRDSGSLPRRDSAGEDGRPAAAVPGESGSGAGSHPGQGSGSGPHPADDGAGSNPQSAPSAEPDSSSEPASGPRSAPESGSGSPGDGGSGSDNSGSGDSGSGNSGSGSGSGSEGSGSDHSGSGSSGSGSSGSD